jgi:hypothetical protein
MLIRLCVLCCLLASLTGCGSSKIKDPSEAEQKKIEANLEKARSKEGGQAMP